MTETLWRIEAPHFVAGLVVKDDRIIESAPILRWAIGKRWGWMRSYCQSKGWHGQNLNKLEKGDGLESN